MLKLSLQEKLETLKLLDSQILQLTDEGELEDEIEQADSFRENIHAAMVKIEEHCTVPLTTLPAAGTHPREPPTNVPGTIDPPHGSRVKLPKLSIHPLNGDITAWTTFWDSYDSAIHQNPELSDINKFNYLKSLLEHAAYEAIAGLALTSVNYHEAITTLKKRFGNKQQIIDKHMDVLLHVEPVTSQHNLKGLRRMYDLAESHIRGLRSLGVSSDSYGSLLSSVLFSKLLQELCLVVTQNTSHSDWNLDTLMKAMEEEIQVRERSAADSVQPPKKPSREQPTAGTLLSRSTGPACCYCQQGHPSSACETVTQMEARKQILKKSGRCFNCLRRGHISRECRSTGVYTTCGSRHHASICPKCIPPGEPHPPPSCHPPERPKHSASNPTKPGLNAEAAAYTPPPNVTLYASMDQAVLQMAQTLVYNPVTPSDLLEAWVVLDAGSQRSYISHHTRDALSLATEGEQRMSIATFGSCGETQQVCEAEGWMRQATENAHSTVDMRATVMSTPISLPKHNWSSRKKNLHPVSKWMCNKADISVGSKILL